MRRVGFDHFVWLWNQLQGLGLPPVHDRIVHWLAERWEAGDRHLLLMAFRGCGKSTLVGLFAAWLLARDPNLRILVLAAEQALARKMVRTVKRIVERHPLAAVRNLKPARPDQWAADQFTVNRSLELRDPSMLARGIEANITGSRADVVICDDVEVPNTCDTAPKRADLRARLAEIDFVLTPGGLTLYVGTPHTYYTLYADAPRPEVGETEPFLADFTRLQVPILDAHGASAWPDRFPLAVIERRRRHVGPNKFASQMMLSPVTIAEGRLDPDRLRSYDGDLDYQEAQGTALLTLNGRRLVSASGWWDPAYGAGAPAGPAAEGKGGDASVVAAMFADADGNYYLHRIEYLTIDAADPAVDAATQQCRAVAAFARALHLPAVCLEINGLGRFLPGVLRRELARAGVACAVVEVASHLPKQRRILEAFDAVLAAGALHAHRTVWTTPFIREMREWRPDGRYRGRDDGLDAVAGCLRAEPVRLGTLPRPTRGTDWRPGGAVVEGAWGV